MSTDTPLPEPPRAGFLRSPRAFLARARTDSLARNSLFIMATTVVNSGLGYAFWVVAARTYPTRQVGLAAGLIAAMTLASMLSNLGAGSTLIQTLPTRQAGRDWSRTFTACMGTGLGTAILAGCAALLLLPALSPGFAILREPAYRVVIVAGVLFWTASTILDDVFVAERAAGEMLAKNSTAAILKLAMMLGFVALGGRMALGIVSAWTASTAGALVIGGALLLPRLHRSYRPHLRGVATEARRLVSPFIGHYFINLGGYIPMYLLPLLVAARLSVTDTAYFYVTWMLANIAFMVSPAVGSALFAEGSHARETVYRKARTSLYLTGLLLIFPVTVLLLGGRFIVGLFGPGYAEHSYMLLVLLAVSTIPEAISNIYVSVLRVERRLRAASALNMSIAIGTVLLAWYLLPLMGIAGAGLAWLIVQTAASVAVGIDLVIRGFTPPRTRETPDIQPPSHQPPRLGVDRK